MLVDATVQAQLPLKPVFIFHPVTQELWDISPLLQMLHEASANEPSRMAEAVYDIGRYIVAEQHSHTDTAVRLRQMVARLERLAVAFDSIQVRTTEAARPPIPLRVA